MKTATARQDIFVTLRQFQNGENNASYTGVEALLAEIQNGKPLQESIRAQTLFKPKPINETLRSFYEDFVLGKTLS
jgi:hypothetical protein